MKAPRLRKWWTRWRARLACLAIDMLSGAALMASAITVSRAARAAAETNSEAFAVLGSCCGFTMGAAFLLVSRTWGVPRDYRGGDDA